jgi:hypothetical protein
MIKRVFVGMDALTARARKLEQQLKAVCLLRARGMYNMNIYAPRRDNITQSIICAATGVQISSGWKEMCLVLTGLKRLKCVRAASPRCEREVTPIF